MEVDRK